MYSIYTICINRTLNGQKINKGKLYRSGTNEVRQKSKIVEKKVRAVRRFLIYGKSCLNENRGHSDYF